MGAETAREVVKTVESPAPVPATREVAVPAAPVPLATRPMAVGRADDQAEHDADLMADTALSRLSTSADEGAHGPQGASTLRRSAGPTAKAKVGRAGGALDAGTSAAIEQRRGAGRPLSGSVRDRMEAAFGTSFSAVRIHDDASSAELNESVSARAFTTGRDIFFGQGQFAPDSREGERVLAHELAHTLQHGRDLQRWPDFFKKDDAATAAAKIAKKDSDAREKAALAKKKAEDKAANKADKGAVAAATVREKEEDTGLKSERETGVGMRGVLKERIGAQTLASKKAGQAEVEATGKATTAQGSKALGSLQNMFAMALDVEKQKKAEYLGKKMGEEEAAELAYQDAWIDQLWLPEPSNPLRAVRPPRETASERLASGIRQQRTNEAAEAMGAKGNAADAVNRGKLLPPEVEKVYEEWESWVQDAIKGGHTPEEAERNVEAMVWKMADDDVAKLRPKDKKVEQEARAQAKARLRAGTVAKPESMPDIEVADRGLSAAGAAIPIVGLGGVAGQTTGALMGAAADSALAKAQGITNPISHSAGAQAPIVGGAVKAAETAAFAKAHGIKDPGALKSASVSLDTQVGNGIGATTGIINDILAGAKAALKAVKAVGAAHEHTTTENVLTATKASADTASTLSRLAADAAKLSAIVDGSVAGAVAKILPGFSIVIAVTSMVSGLIRFREVGQQVDGADDGLFKLRLSGESAAKVDVLVRPFQFMVSSLNKKYEQSVWAMVKAVSDTVTSISNLVLAGGFGIPAAIQAATAALDALHSIAHMIDDNIRAIEAQAARKDSVGALEGAAEGQLRKDPALAMDAIVFQAKTKKDKVALAFLSTYGVSPEETEKLPMTKIRERALFEMGVGADPLTTYQNLKMIGGGVLGAVGEGASTVGKAVSDPFVNTVDQYKGSAQLASDRKGMDGKERDWRWRLKMAFKSKESYDRSVAQTAVKVGPKSVASTVMCKVGSNVLFASATEEQQTSFAERIKNMSLVDLMKAKDDPNNSQTWRDIITAMCSEQLKKKKLPPPPLPPRPKKATAGAPPAMASGPSVG